MALQRSRTLHDATGECNHPEVMHMMLFLSDNWTLSFLYAVANIYQKFDLFDIMI